MTCAGRGAFSMGENRQGRPSVGESAWSYSHCTQFEGRSPFSASGRLDSLTTFREVCRKAGEEAGPFKLSDLDHGYWGGIRHSPIGQRGASRRGENEGAEKANSSDASAASGGSAAYVPSNSQARSRPCPTRTGKSSP